MIAALARDTLGRVSEESRRAALDERVLAFAGVLDKLATEVSAVRGEGAKAVVSGLELLLIEAKEIADDAGRAPGYEVAGMLVTAVVSAMLVGAGDSRGD